MKIKLKFFTVRLDGNIIDAHHIRTPYDEVAIEIQDCYFTDNDLRKYFKESAAFDPDWVQEEIRDIRAVGYLRTEQPAADLVGNYTRISMQIEEKEVELR